MPLRSILIVDDDSLVRWSLGQHLTQQGFDVVTAGSAAEARALVTALPELQLIVLDFKLPDMDGLTLLEALRRDGSGCPVIVLSAHVTQELRLRALAAGATLVAEKPFQLDAVHALVRQALGPRSATPG